MQFKIDHDIPPGMLVDLYHSGLFRTSSLGRLRISTLKLTFDNSKVPAEQRRPAVVYGDGSEALANSTYIESYGIRNPKYALNPATLWFKAYMAFRNLKDHFHGGLHSYAQHASMEQAKDRAMPPESLEFFSLDRAPAWDEKNLFIMGPFTTINEVVSKTELAIRGQRDGCGFNVVVGGLAFNDFSLHQLQKRLEHDYFKPIPATLDARVVG